MRFRRSVLIAVLASVLIAPSLFAQTKTVGADLDTMDKVPAVVDASVLLNESAENRRVLIDGTFGKINVNDSTGKRGLASMGQPEKSIWLLQTSNRFLIPRKGPNT